MGTINVVKTIKFVHEFCVVLVKIGTFYSVYGKDEYINTYLYKYKKKERKNVPICSFPVYSLSKVENTLEKNKINYIVVDRRSNYKIEEKVINKQKNNYEKMLEKANKSITYVLRIQKIYDFLLEKRDSINIEKKLKQIEEVLQND